MIDKSIFRDKKKDKEVLFYYYLRYTQGYELNNTFQKYIVKQMLGQFYWNRF